jgi:hypothetical protein
MYAFDFGYVNFSYSGEFEEQSAFVGLSLGLEFAYETSSYSKETTESRLHFFGLNYKYGFDNNKNIISLSYLSTLKFEPFFVCGTIGFGTNISYNFNGNIFGIGPQISFILISFFLKCELIYRYNVIFSANNSHEIEVKLGIVAFSF